MLNLSKAYAGSRFLSVVPARAVEMAWLSHAPCGDTDVDFFSDGEEMIRRARQICASCPVAAQCLSFARQTNPEFGVWAGKTADELRGRAPKRPQHAYSRRLVCRFCSGAFRNREANYYCSTECRLAARARRKAG